MIEQPNIPNGFCIVKHFAGSISYGTQRPNSDVDYRGLFKAEDKFLTPLLSYKEYEDGNEEDTKYYELSRFFELAAEKNNPNILETLWVNEEDIVYKNEVYDFLRTIREDFLSKKVAVTSAGLAFGKMKKYSNHNKWINNPKKEEPPLQCDFVSLVQNFTNDKIFKIDLRDYNEGWRLIPYSKTLFGMVRDNNSCTFDLKGDLNFQHNANGEQRETPSFLVEFKKEEYEKEKVAHKGYWDWKNNRNQKRREEEEINGYDTKDGMHLVRLMRMSIEILRDGEFIVKRPDAKELLEIREGKYSYKEIMAVGTELKKEVEALAKISKIQSQPDFSKLAQHLVTANNIASDLEKKLKNSNKNRIRPR